MPGSRSKGLSRDRARRLQRGRRPSRDTGIGRDQQLLDGRGVPDLAARRRNAEPIEPLGDLPQTQPLRGQTGSNAGQVRTGRRARRVAKARLRASSSCGLPRRTPRALAAASAAFVCYEIISRSCSATAARMCIVSLVACGLSQATKSTPESISDEMNATLRANRSSLAMTST